MKQRIHFEKGEIYLPKDYLIKIGIPQKTIQNGKRLYYKSKSKSWRSMIKYENGVPVDYICFNSIPQNQRKKHNLIEKDFLYQTTQSDKFLIDNNDSDYNNLFVKFNNAINIDWPRFVKYYESKFKSSEEIDKYAKNHSVFEAINNLLQENYSREIIYEIYFKNDNGLIFQTRNIKSFFRKILEARKNGIENALIHKSKGRESNLTKLSDHHKERIGYYYGMPAKFSSRHIMDLVNNEFLENGFDPISLSSIKRYLAKPEIKNKYYALRFGKKATKEKFIPFLKRLEPTYSNDVWEMDGTKAQFLCKNERGELGFLTYYVIMDVHSRKIIGYSFDKHENASMVIRALRKACSNCNQLPSEIICDKFPGFNSENTKRIIERSKKMGVIWRITINPRDKGHVERFFGTFQSVFCKTEFGYIGEGIKSKRKNSKPSQELNNIFSKNENVRTQSQLIELLISLIEKYNRFEIKDFSLSPTQKFDISKRKNAIRIRPDQFANLFFLERIETVENSMVSFQFNCSEYTYLIMNHKSCLELNLSKIRIRFDEDNLDEIFMYKLDNNEFIEKIKRFQMPSMAIVNQNEEDRRIINQFKLDSKKLISELGLDEEYKIEEIYPLYNVAPQKLPKIKQDKAECDFFLSESKILRDIKNEKQKSIELENLYHFSFSKDFKIEQVDIIKKRDG